MGFRSTAGPGDGAKRDPGRRARRRGRHRGSPGEPRQRPSQAMNPLSLKARWTAYAEDFRLGLDSLLAHRLRALLTMLGMVFGVAAVVSMLSIGAGAERRV